jgi:hypothetical protein
MNEIEQLVGSPQHVQELELHARALSRKAQVYAAQLADKS